MSKSTEVIEDKELDFSDYNSAGHELAKQIFGKDVFKQLCTTSYEGFDWEGLDITTHHLLATCFNIKERFSPSNIPNHKKNGKTALDLFIQAIFHYGYQQCVSCEWKDLKELYDMTRVTVGFMKIENDKLKEEKEKLEMYVQELKDELGV